MGRRYSEAPSDNVQQTMNLIMPLEHSDPTTLASLAMYMKIGHEHAGQVGERYVPKGIAAPREGG